MSSFSSSQPPDQMAPSFSKQHRPPSKSDLTLTEETKSDLSLVLDLTKQQCLTTTMQVRRDKHGTFLYSIHKQVDSEVEAVIGGSPSTFDEIRESLVARDYIPKLVHSQDHRQVTGISSVDKTEQHHSSKSNDASKPSEGGKGLKNQKEKKRKKRDRKKKKLLEKMKETTCETIKEVVLKHAEPKSLVAQSMSRISVSATNIKLPQARSSQVRFVPKRIDYETVKVSQVDSGNSEMAAKSSLDAFLSPKECSSVKFAIPSDDLVYKMESYFEEERKKINVMHGQTKQESASIDGKCKLSPTSAIFRIPPNADQIRTPSPPGTQKQRQQVKPVPEDDSSPSPSNSPGPNRQMRKYPTSVTLRSILTSASFSPSPRSPGKSSPGQDNDDRTSVIWARLEGQGEMEDEKAPPENFKTVTSPSHSGGGAILKENQGQNDNTDDDEEELEFMTPMEQQPESKTDDKPASAEVTKETPKEKIKPSIEESPIESVFHVTVDEAVLKETAVQEETLNNSNDQPSNDSSSPKATNVSVKDKKTTEKPKVKGPIRELSQSEKTTIHTAVEEYEKKRSQRQKEAQDKKEELFKDSTKDVTKCDTTDEEKVTLDEVEQEVDVTSSEDGPKPKEEDKQEPAKIEDLREIEIAEERNDKSGNNLTNHISVKPQEKTEQPVSVIKEANQSESHMKRVNEPSSSNSSSPSTWSEQSTGLVYSMDLLNKTPKTAQQNSPMINRKWQHKPMVDSPSESSDITDSSVLFSSQSKLATTPRAKSNVSLRMARSLERLSMEEIDVFACAITKSDPKLNRTELVDSAVQGKAQVGKEMSPLTSPKTDPDEEVPEHSKDMVVVQSSLVKQSIPQSRSAQELENIPVVTSGEKIIRSTSFTPQSKCCETPEKTSEKPKANSSPKDKGVKVPTEVKQQPQPENYHTQVNDPPTDKLEPMRQSKHFESHLKFYLNQEQFLLTMEECNPQSSIEQDSPPRSIETEDELVGRQDNLVQRQNSFAERYKNSLRRSDSFAELITATATGRPAPNETPAQLNFAHNEPNIHSVQCTPPSNVAFYMALTVVVGLLLVTKFIF